MTDTDRFAVLHDAADALLDELTERYMVERRETKELLGADEALVRTVRLIPRTPAAAPLAIAFTGLPGLRVRLGRWWTQTLPDCACADCGEDPAHLVPARRDPADRPVRLHRAGVVAFPSEVRGRALLPSASMT